MARFATLWILMRSLGLNGRAFVPMLSALRARCRRHGDAHEERRRDRC